MLVLRELKKIPMIERLWVGMNAESYVVPAAGLNVNLSYSGSIQNVSGNNGSDLFSRFEDTRRSSAAIPVATPMPIGL